VSRRTMIGATGTSASYTLLASLTFHAWKVIWRQQHPIPKAIASILMYGSVGPGLAGTRMSAIDPIAKVSKTYRHAHYFEGRMYPLAGRCSYQQRLGL
jgi:hypothetical protein